MNIKKFSSILFCLFPLLTMAQVIQPCIVKQYNKNETKTPLSGVQVEVRGAGTEVSDAHGNLTLTFTTLKPGDRVTLRSITKNGYEVFNTSAVEQWTLSRNNTPFLIVLVRSDYMIQLKNSLKQNSLENYKLKLDQTKKELKKERDAGKLRDEDYRKQIDALEDQYDKALQNLDNYIDRFAHIDLSEVNKEEQRILELVQKGHINEAVEVYESLRISDKLLKERNDLKKIDTAAKKLEEKRKQKQDNIDALNEALNREITTLMLAGGQENFDKIGNMLKEQALADTTNVVMVEEYALYALSQKNYQDAERFYQIMLIQLSDAQNEEELLAKADAYNDLAYMFSCQHRYDQAEKYYNEALLIKTQLCLQDTVSYLVSLARTQHDLGLYYLESDQTNKAIPILLSALEKFNQLNSDEYCFETAACCLSLGVLYNHTHEYQKSEFYLTKALENSKVSFLKDSTNASVRHNLAQIQRALGELYERTHNYSQAENMLNQSLNHRRALFLRNPDAYRNSYAEGLREMGKLYEKMGDDDKAEHYYLEALDQCRLLFEQDSIVYCNALSKTLNWLAVSYLNSGNYFKAEKAILEELKLDSILFYKDSVNYRNFWAVSLITAGELYVNLKEFPKAEQFLVEGLYHMTILYQQNPQLYWTEFVRVQNTIGSLYFDLGDYHTASKYFSVALDYYLIRFNQAPEAFREEVAKLQYNQGVIYDLFNDYEASQQYYAESLENFSILAEQMPQVYFPYVLDLYNRFAYLYARNGNFYKAIESIDKAIQILPSDPNFYDSKGEILLMQGDVNGALEMWKKVLELDADFEKHMEEIGSASELYRQLKERGLAQ